MRPRVRPPLRPSPKALTTASSPGPAAAAPRSHSQRAHPSPWLLTPWGPPRSMLRLQLLLPLLLSHLLAMLLPVERRGAKDRGVKELELTGDVAGRDCILVDDMIDTGLTLTKASRELIARGASCVVAFATHALLSHDAADRLARCEELSFIVITNSLPVMASLPKDHRLRRKLVVLSAAPMLAHQICTLSGLPLPDIDPREPTHSLHASSGPSVEEACTPAYLMRKAEAEAFRGSQPGSTEGDSLFDEEGGMRSGRDRDGDSVTTESEYSAY
jgi:hypothetical protein